MNYVKIYDDLVVKARSENRVKLKRDNPNYIYYENHHIVPRCLKGSDDKDNLVLLTAREHFIAHKLLVEINPYYNGLINAMMMMCTCKNKYYIISSREYEYYRKLYIEVMKVKNKGQNHPMFGSHRFGELAPMFGKTHSEETKKRISESRMGFIVSEEQKEKLRKCKAGQNHPMFGCHRFDELAPMFGKKHSEETKKRISIIKKGIKQETVTCPYCNKYGGVSNMIRYHFDNCKENPEYVSKLELLSCPHCGFKSTSKVNMNRWHFDNCKKYRNL